MTQEQFNRLFPHPAKAGYKGQIYEIIGVNYELREVALLAPNSIGGVKWVGIDKTVPLDKDNNILK